MMREARAKRSDKPNKPTMSKRLKNAIKLKEFTKELVNNTLLGCHNFLIGNKISLKTPDISS